MTPALTQDMVDGIYETSDFMHQKPPFTFAPSGIKHGRPPVPYRTSGLVTARSRGISIVGAEQGQRDAHRRDALKRGGI